MPPPIVIVPLGTSSAVPSMTRNHSSLAIILPTANTLLFDCGEATQNQLLKYKTPVRASKISTIFITHLHGDHLFGLCPLLASILNGAGGTVGKEDERTAYARAQAATGDQKPDIKIYGPKGLRDYVRTNMKLTYTCLGSFIQINELHCQHEYDILEDPSKGLYEMELPGANIPQNPITLLWEDFHTTPEGFFVSAASIKHSVPCIGYVLAEPLLPGKIPQEYPQKLTKHKKYFTSHGIRNPMVLLSALQLSPIPIPHPSIPDHIFDQQGIHMPDGTLLPPPKPRKGRKITILGDTYDPSDIMPLAYNSDVLIHEATNAYLPDLDPDTKQEDTYEIVEERCKSRGHSTPEMAGRFARLINLGGPESMSDIEEKVDVKPEEGLLVLNHFSVRYKDDGADGVGGAAAMIMEGIRMCAERAWLDGGGKYKGRVICARDGVPIEVKA